MAKYGGWQRLALSIWADVIKLLRASWVRRQRSARRRRLTQRAFQLMASFRICLSHLLRITACMHRAVCGMAWRRRRGGDGGGSSWWHRRAVMAANMAHAISGGKRGCGKAARVFSPRSSQRFSSMAGRKWRRQHQSCCLCVAAFRDVSANVVASKIRAAGFSSGRRGRISTCSRIITAYHCAQAKISPLLNEKRRAAVASAGRSAANRLAAYRALCTHLSRHRTLA